jgi:beta-glucosidase-like glycosyl hydrolase
MEYDSGAVQDMNLIEKLGAQMGEQSKRLGLQFNFAPVLDINTNPKNPYRFPFFGEDKYKVTERAIALMKGMQGKVFYRETFSWSRDTEHTPQRTAHRQLF